MTTDADRAQDLELAEYERTQAQAIRPRSTVPSAPFCGDCGGDIPPQRQAAVPGVQLCTGCQDWHERKQQQRR